MMMPQSPCLPACLASFCFTSDVDVNTLLPLKQAVVMGLLMMFLLFCIHIISTPLGFVHERKTIYSSVRRAEKAEKVETSLSALID